MKQLMYAIVPNKERWTQGLSFNSKHKFVKMHFLMDTEADPTKPLYYLEPKTGNEGLGYTQLPVLEYKTGQDESLCKRALPDAVICNRYEQAMLERSEIANYPPMIVSIDLQNRGGYDLGPNGIVPLKNNERATVRSEMLRSSVVLMGTGARSLFLRGTMPLGPRSYPPRFCRSMETIMGG